MVAAVVALCTFTQGPTLAFSTYLGGVGEDSIRDIAVDAQGNAYLTGGTTSPNFPVTPGAYDTTYNTGGTYQHDVFVTKLDPNGNIVWSTYLGGPNYDRAYAVELDSQGNIYVAGRAGQGFPVTAGAFQTQFLGSPNQSPYGPQDGFIAKLSPDGGQLLWASYFGTNDLNIIRDIDLDQEGNVFLASSYSSGTFSAAVAPAFQNSIRSTPIGLRDGVLAKVTADGSAVLWATYLGGSLEEHGTSSVRCDAAGRPVFLISAMSSDCRTTYKAYDRTHNGGTDYYIVKLTADGSTLMFATYLGGNGGDGLETHELALGIKGDIYVASGTSSTNFPAYAACFQGTYGGSGGSGTGQGTNYWGDICVSHLDPSAVRLLACTYVGGRYGESCEGVAVDQQGSVYLTGATYSDNFPTTSNAYQPQLRGTVGNNNADALVVKLGKNLLPSPAYVSYIGGTAVDLCRAADIGPDGTMWIGGMGMSNDWPLVNPIQNVRAGGTDALVAMFRL
jgi:hypothetical protein